MAKNRRQKPPPRGGDPSQLGSLLTRAESTARARGRVGVDGDTWLRAVGSRIAARATPGRLERGTLTVHVASAVWAQELSFLTQDIVRRLGREGIQLEAVRFRVQEQAERHQAPAEPAPPAVQPVELPGDLAQRVEQIDDPELRQIVAEAAGYSLSLQREREASPTSSSKPASIKPRSSAPARRSAAPETAQPDQSDASRPRGPAGSRGTRRDPRR